MQTVEEIGNEEAVLLAKMPLDGFIEQRHEYLNKHGLYDEWRDIYRKYVDLAQVGDLEALKRPLFFAWYQVSEPGWLSGINELPDRQTILVLNFLEERLAHGRFDDELKHMLRYYFIICDYYLERFYPLPNILKISVFLGELDRSLPEVNVLGYRGQMGDYWESVT